MYYSRKYKYDLLQSNLTFAKEIYKLEEILINEYDIYYCKATLNKKIVTKATLFMLFFKKKEKKIKPKV